jgi:hypothetical protein
VFRFVKSFLVFGLSSLDSKELDTSNSWFSLVALPISKLLSIVDSATITTLFSVVSMVVPYSYSMSGDSSLRGAAVLLVHTLLGSP